MAYHILNNSIYSKAKNGTGDQITNFDFKITEDKEYIEVGGSSKHGYQMELVNEQGEKMTLANVTAEEYDTGKWTSRLGSRVAVLNPSAFKKVLPQKLLNKDIKHTKICKFVGFHINDDSHCYVDNNGTFTSEGYNPKMKAETPGKFSFFSLPAPTRDKKKLRFAIRTVLDLDMLTPNNPGVGILVKAAAAQAIISIFIPNSMTLFLIGETGSRKTALMALSQSFFGSEFHDSQNVPTAWNSTSTSLQDILIKYRTLLVIDDFIPVANVTANDLSVKAEEVLRTHANGTSKHRSNSRGELLPTTEPGAQVLMSGESLNMNFTDSMVKRITFFPITKDDVDLEALTTFQEHGKNGVFAQFSSSLIQSTLKDQEAVERKLQKRYSFYRTKATQEVGGNAHGRLNDNIASLMVALEFLYQFALEHKAITEDEYNSYIKSDWDTLKVLLIEQEIITKKLNLATIVNDAIATALQNGLIHVRNYKTGGCPKNIRFDSGWKQGKPSGEFFGWVDSKKNLIYIPSNTVITILKDTIHGDYANLLDSSKRRFWRIIASYNGLVISNSDRNTVRRTDPKTGEAIDVYALKM